MRALASAARRLRSCSTCLPPSLRRRRRPRASHPLLGASEEEEAEAERKAPTPQQRATMAAMPLPTLLLLLLLATTGLPLMWGRLRPQGYIPTSTHWRGTQMMPMRGEVAAAQQVHRPSASEVAASSCEALRRWPRAGTGEAAVAQMMGLVRRRRGRLLPLRRVEVRKTTCLLGEEARSGPAAAAAQAGLRARPRTQCHSRLRKRASLWAPLLSYRAVFHGSSSSSRRPRSGLHICTSPATHTTSLH